MTTVRDIAQSLCGTAGYGTEDAMLTLVTTLAAQTGYAAPMGGQSPDLEIGERDAETIRECAVILVNTQREIDRDLTSPAS